MGRLLKEALYRAGQCHSCGCVHDLPEARCGKQMKGYTYTCILPKGHTGYHIGHDIRKIKCKDEKLTWKQ